MMFKFLTFLLFFRSYLTASLAAPAEPQRVFGNSEGAFDSIRHALKKAGIINDIVDDFMPKCFVAPAYNNTKKTYPVALGNNLKPSKTKESPSLNIYCPELVDPSGLTIILTDPDAPSRDNPKWSEMCHWIAVIPTTKRNSTSSKLQEIVECENLDLCCEEMTDYVEDKPPGPPEKTGYHRYIFLLLEGDNTNLTAPDDRQHWGFGKKGHGVRDWAEKERLDVIGANFFFAKNKKQ